jgi:hypothetical protein
MYIYACAVRPHVNTMPPSFLALEPRVTHVLPLPIGLINAAPFVAASASATLMDKQFTKSDSNCLHKTLCILLRVPPGSNNTAATVVLLEL